jgi:hypothetical protein
LSRAGCRRAAIHGLGKRAHRDEDARQLLRQVAAGDPSPELRDSGATME